MIEAKIQQLETALGLIQKAKRIVQDVCRKKDESSKGLPLYNGVDVVLKEAMEELCLTIERLEGFPNGDWRTVRADD